MYFLKKMSRSILICIQFLLNIILFCSVFYNQVYTQELEVVGKIQANSLKITDGAGDQKILVSDGEGNANWSDFPSNLRSILLSPSDFSLHGASLGFTPSWFMPTLIFADAGTPIATASIPFPADYSGGQFQIKILYTSSTNSGKFKIAFGLRGISVGNSIDQSPAGGFILNPPVMADELAKFESSQPEDPSLFNMNSEFLYLYIRRDSDDDILDTSTGILKIVGIVFSYPD